MAGNITINNKQPGTTQIRPELEKPSIGTKDFARALAGLSVGDQYPDHLNGPLEPAGFRDLDQNKHYPNLKEASEEKRPQLTPAEIAEQEKNRAHQAALAKHNEQQVLFSRLKAEANKEVASLQRQFLKIVQETKQTRQTVDTSKAVVHTGKTESVDNARGLRVYWSKVIEKAHQRVASVHSSDQWAKKQQDMKSRKRSRGSTYGAKGGIEVGKALNEIDHENWFGNSGD